MPRRKQFESISHDVLENFVSRNNDLKGYWALGQYVNFLQKTEEKKLVFDLKNAMTLPPINELIETAQNYWQVILQIMRANKMPAHWLRDAKITFSIAKQDYYCCILEITSDQNKTYKYQRSVLVRPHDPNREWPRCKEHHGLPHKYKLN